MAIELPNAPAQDQAQQTEPIVQLSGSDRFWRRIWRHLKPDEAAAIIDNAIQGDLSMQAQLFNRMLDSWPRLLANRGELVEKVSALDWNEGIMPHIEPGANEPTNSAAEKADLVRRCFAGMEQEPSTLRNGFRDLVQDLADTYLTGHVIQEIEWKLAGMEWCPTGTFDVPAKYYRYTYPSYNTPDRLLFVPSGLNMTQTGMVEWPDNRFLLGVWTGSRAHPTVSARLRALVQIWMGAIFGLRWLMEFAQIYGIPLRHAFYDDQHALPKIEEMLANMGAAGWGAFPKGTEINIEQPSATSASSLPQAGLMDFADRACDVVVLGQTLTTDVGNSGSRALGEVHNEVRIDRINSTANFVCRVLNQQFIPMIMRLNYGNDDEMPYCAVEAETPRNELADVERDKVLFYDMGLEVSKQWLYERHNVEMPDENAELYDPGKPDMDQLFNERGEQEDESGEQEDEDMEARLATIKARRDVLAKTEDMLSYLTGAGRDYLRNVTPIFQELYDMALAREAITDEEFEQRLTAAANIMPQLFDDLRTESLIKAMEDTMGAEFVNGQFVAEEPGG